MGQAWGGRSVSSSSKSFVSVWKVSRVPSAALHGMPDHYKIKLRQLGYRLVYKVNDATVMVVVVAVLRWNVAKSMRLQGGDEQRTADDAADPRCSSFAAAKVSRIACWL